MSKKPSFPVKTLDKFIELGVTGNIENVRVVTIHEILRVKDSPKGKKGDPLKCSIQLQDPTNTIWIDLWKPEADLPFKLNDVISINEVHSIWDEYHETWQIKSCSRSEVTIHDTGKIPHIPDEVYGEYDTSQHKKPIELGTYSKEKGVGTITVDMPQPPTPDRVVHPYFPGMTIFELRDYHMHEFNGAIRGHIENIIMRKEEAQQKRAFFDALLEAVKK